MYNYYNILPIILIHIFIIILFEGMLFFVYLMKKQEEIVSEQLDNYSKKLIAIINGNLPDIKLIETKEFNDKIQSNNNNYLNTLDSHQDFTKLEKLNSETINVNDILQRRLTQELKSQNLNINDKLALKKALNVAMDNEKQYLENNYKKGMHIFIAILGSIILLLAFYTYLVYYVWKQHIDWKDVLIIVGSVILLIVIMELLYVFGILFNKKFNYSHIKLAFIDALIK